MEKIDVAIIGGGIAGLGAQVAAAEQGRESVVFEASDRAGGLLDNFEIDGFRFDNAVHLSFTSDRAVREIFDQTATLVHSPEAKCFDGGVWLKHPVQNNLYPLSAETKVALVESFMARPNETADNYEAWLRHQYGHALAERYPLRYTRKYWGTEAHNLSTSWIGNRMSRATLKEILFGSYSPVTPNTYYVKEMRYPRQGGYRAFLNPLLRKARVACGHEVTAVEPKQQQLRFANGRTVSYEKLVSTIPLPELVKVTVDAPAPLREEAARLQATSIDLISIGFKEQKIDHLWFYIYDDDILASRAYSPTVKSPDNAPPGCSSIQFEVYSAGVTSKFREADLKTNCLFALQRMKLATPSDAAFVHHKRLKYGNVIFLHGTELRRRQIRDWYDASGISTCGRFGEWDYLWSDQSYLSGYRWGAAASPALDGT